MWYVIELSVISQHIWALHKSNVPQRFYRQGWNSEIDFFPNPQYLQILGSENDCIYISLS